MNDAWTKTVSMYIYHFAWHWASDVDRAVNHIITARLQFKEVTGVKQVTVNDYIYMQRSLGIDRHNKEIYRNARVSVYCTVKGDGCPHAAKYDTHHHLEHQINPYSP